MTLLENDAPATTSAGQITVRRPHDGYSGDVVDRPSSGRGDTATLPVAIIGAGPIGLAAAANLVERGIRFTVYEAGDSIADSIRRWGHVRLFSPWSELVDPASRRLLEASGWQHPPLTALPTGVELVEAYLEPLAALPQIAEHVVTGVEVVAVTRDGMDRTRSSRRTATAFSLRLRDSSGTVSDIAARAVIDASGTYRSPNRLGSNGLDPLGLDDVAGHVTHALPDVLGSDRERFVGRRITVVGAGHSAARSLLALATLAGEVPGTRVTWAIRNRAAARLASSADDELTARARLGGRVEALVRSGAIEVVDRVEIVRLARLPDGVRIVTHRDGELVTHDTDVIVNATGFRPDLDMLREVRLDLDEVVEAPRLLAPLIDPNIHTCGTVAPHGFTELQQPEHDFFLAGMKSYGRAPTFLLATGYEQVRSIVAWLDGDTASATRVGLSLPATGVCSTDSAAAPASSCCS